MALILVGGGLLLLMNRLFGMLGVSLSAIALIPLLTGQVVVQRLAIALLSVFSGRAILQVFLDRSYLHQVGVDLTHPYTSFGLLAALFLPLALATVHARPEAPPPPRALEALILALFPLATAYFIHIDPYAAYIAGLLVMTLVAGVLPVSQDRAAKLPNLLPPMLLSGAPLGLLTAAWLLHEINAPRNQRLAFFVIAMLVVAAYWLGATVRRPKAPSQA